MQYPYSPEEFAKRLYGQQLPQKTPLQLAMELNEKNKKKEESYGLGYIIKETLKGAAEDVSGVAQKVSKAIAPVFEPIGKPVAALGKGAVAATGGVVKYAGERISGSSPEEAEIKAGEFATKIMEAGGPVEMEGPTKAVMAPFEQVLEPLLDKMSVDISSVSGLPQGDVKKGIEALIVFSPLLKVGHGTVKALATRARIAKLNESMIASLEKLPGELSIDEVMSIATDAKKAGKLHKSVEGEVVKVPTNERLLLGEDGWKIIEERREFRGKPQYGLKELLEDRKKAESRSEHYDQMIDVEMARDQATGNVNPFTIEEQRAGIRRRMELTTEEMIRDIDAEIDAVQMKKVTGEATTIGEQFPAKNIERAIKQNDRLVTDPEVELESLGRNPNKTKDIVVEGEHRTISEITPDEVIRESKEIAAGRPEYNTEIDYKYAGIDLRAVVNSMGVDWNKVKPSFGESWHSPDVIMYRNPKTRAIYDGHNMAEMKKAIFLDREYGKFDVVSKKFKDGSPLDAGVTRMREGGLTVEDIIKKDSQELKQSGFTDHEITEIRKRPDMARQWNDFQQDRYEFLMRKYGESVLGIRKEQLFWEKTASKETKTFKRGASPVSDKVSKQWYEKLTPEEKEVFDVYSRRLGNYVPHLFYRSELIEYLKAELIGINKRLTKMTPDSKKFLTIEKQRLEHLHALEKIQKGDPIFWDVLPSKVLFKFFEPRKGGEGYQMSGKVAYRAYLAGISKKIFIEPALKESMRLYGDVPIEMKPYTNWYIREQMGLNRTPMSDVFGLIKSLQWMRTLGLNPRSAVVNLTQRLNTIADVGPTYSTIGWVKGFTKEGNRLFEQSGLEKTIPSVLMEGEAKVNTSIEAMREITGYMFSKIEKGNLKHAYLANYYKLKKKFPKASEEWLNNESVKGAQKAQFRYGKVNMPRALRGGKGVVFQFWSYPIKQLEFLTKLAKENPLKLAGWIAMSEGSRVALDEFLGIDLSSALGIGINYGEIIEVLRSIKDEDLRRASIHLKQSGIPLVSKTGGGLFPYGLGPGMDSLQNIGKLLSGKMSSVEFADEEAPVPVKRVVQTVRAIKEGKSPSGEYPIRDRVTGDLMYMEKPYQLFIRNFVGRPVQEKEIQDVAFRNKLISEAYRNAQQEISRLIVDGDIDKALEIATEYGIRPSRASVEALMLRKMLTVEERMLMNKAKAMGLFEEKMK